jgi:hypothetical protein
MKSEAPESPIWRMMMEKEKMEKEGWHLGSISSGAHLKRWLEEYKEMGFDVYLEKIDLSKKNKEEGGSSSECTLCYDNEAEPPYQIYIKSREPVVE